MNARIWFSFRWRRLWRWQCPGKAHPTNATTVMIIAFACLAGGVCMAAKEQPPTIYQIPLPAKPDFSAVDWLVGEWTGKTTDPSAPAEIRLSVTYELDKQIMLFRGESSMQATKTSPAVKQSWMGVLTQDRGRTGYLLRTFSSTGFITRYRLTIEGPETRVNPEGGDQPPPGWLFRTVITRTDAQELVETVQAAPPNKSFFDYYTAKLRRVAAQDKGKTSATPEKKTSATPEAKTPATPETKTSATQETKTSTTPETKTSTTPEAKTSATPETKTSTTPEAKTPATPPQ